MFIRKTLPYAVLSACAFAQPGMAAETTDTGHEERISILAPIVVTATRQAQDSFDLPVAIDVVEKENIQDGQARMTLSESLIRVPGITAQNRTQMAQDPQISTRGFGARSSFGVRGVRVYVDGIPLTMPDGQGQPGNVDLDIVQGVEVLRGPFSALYGNSSGGVIQMLTEDAAKTPEVSAGVVFGSYGTSKESVRASGTSEGIEYLVNYSNYESDGYRDHSASSKKQGTAKFKINLNEDTKLTTLVNWFDQDAQDPLGLTRTEVAANRKQASPAAYAADTRVSRTNTQVGFNLEHKLDENNSLNLITWVGTRDNLQYLSTGGNAGRASSISREFWGSELRWNNQGLLFNKPYTFNAGLAYGKMNDDRLDTPTSRGEKSAAPTRNEKNIATNSDQYVQGKWSVLDSLDLHAGLRRTKVSLEIDDKFIASGNPDNSGNLTYEKTTPVVGAVWKVNPLLNFYANYGKGFETPTFIEVAYLNNSVNSTPNFGLKPSTSKNFEVGTKAFLSDNTQLNATLFKTLTDDEIVALSSGGTSSYINAPKTKRNGAEVSIESRLAHNISLYGAYTLLNAKFDSDYVGSAGQVNSGNTIPGTYHTQIYAEAAWKHIESGFRTAFEARHNSKAYVNDTNTDSAPSYTIFNVRAGFEQQLKSWRFSEFVRVENIFDKDYIGSVRVNDGNSRFFEPAAGRNWLLGLNANYRF
ncbi:TonB-dependent receptor [Methylovorus sp. MP688]|uniref:TonB-dependent receptor family protein n=1 Tax=Methylovorus sp. (strain MP688) TaxID=887061 RepID=UPI0001EC4899|nr:TonB-dependent receptor [Methylovorus sp. MP688]ADQ85438.1 TonB-dependent receptor [Methylovorus sp. MP688]